MDLSSTKFRILFIGLDLLLYASITVPLLLSLFGKLQFELGHFGCNDTSIRLDLRPSSVGKTSLLLFYFVLPFIFILLIESFHCFFLKQTSTKTKLIASLKIVYHFFVRYFVWATLNILLNDILKVMTAVPRPHFIESCNPDWHNIDCSQNSGMVRFSRSVCLSSDTEKVFDAMKSWPSGHAQLAAFATIFLLAYLEFRLSEEHSVMLKRWLQSIILIFPVYSSASRIHDNKHHVSDVVWGAVIGGVMALIFCWNIQLLQSRSKDSELNQAEARNSKPANEKQKRPSRMQLIQSEFGAIEEMESEIGNGPKSHNNHVFNHQQ